MVVSYDCFCFLQRSKPPLNFQIIISRNALYNSAFFYKQFEVIWLIGVFGVAVEVSCEIDTSCRHPVMLHDSLVGRLVFILPVYFGQKCHHVSHLYLLSQTRTDLIGPPCPD